MIDSKMADINIEETKDQHRSQDTTQYRFSNLTELIEKY